MDKDHFKDLPKNFFDDIVLKPSFYMPENFDLQNRTHNSIRHTLFYETLVKVRFFKLFLYQ